MTYQELDQENRIAYDAFVQSMRKSGCSEEKIAAILAKAMDGDWND